MDLIVEALTELSSTALQNGIKICMETHDSWCNPENVAEIIRKVNHEAVAVNWDIMHPVLRADYTIEKAYEVLKPWIMHVHVHDGIKTEKGSELRPIGKGQVDHHSAIKLLQASGYSGFISGEWISWEPYEIHLPRELSALKSFE
jgi:sugar phosphate isomerase/epimerase